MGRAERVAKKAAASWPHESPSLASETKHLTQLVYPLPALRRHVVLRQDSGNGKTTGSTLWLSAQLMALHVQSSKDLSRGNGRTAIELGAGIGLLSILLAGLGWDVTATDIEPSLSQVLAPNIETNREAWATTGGSCTAKHLDWQAAEAKAADAKVDLIVTTDTLYSSELTAPLFRTIRNVAGPHTQILIGLERRDPGLIDAALELAQREYGLRLEQIPAGANLSPAWDPDELLDVELYAARLAAVDQC